MATAVCARRHRAWKRNRKRCLIGRGIWQYGAAIRHCCGDPGRSLGDAEGRNRDRRVELRSRPDSLRACHRIHGATSWPTRADGKLGTQHNKQELRTARQALRVRCIGSDPRSGAWSGASLGVGRRTCTMAVVDRGEDGRGAPHGGGQATALALCGARHPAVLMPNTGSQSCWRAVPTTLKAMRRGRAIRRFSAAPGRMRICRLPPCQIC